MPIAAPKPCRHMGCSRLSKDGSGYCEDHIKDRRTGRFADERRGSRHHRGYGTKWDHIRKRILRRDEGLCQSCKRKGLYRPAKIVDHIKPKFEGGTDDDDNLESVCKRCSDIKTAQEAFRARSINKSDG
ncbi:MAG: HNH endonuclease [Propionivibrio sp.]|nr:HNH endonuclease [Propionivibrio sp.]